MKKFCVLFKVGERKVLRMYVYADSECEAAYIAEMRIATIGCDVNFDKIEVLLAESEVYHG